VLGYAIDVDGNICDSHFLITFLAIKDNHTFNTEAYSLKFGLFDRSRKLRQSFHYWQNVEYQTKINEKPCYLS
jgi:hypothetical protein